MIVQLMHLNVDFVYVQLTLIYVPKEGRKLELGHDNSLEVIEQQLTVITQHHYQILGRFNEF